MRRWAVLVVAAAAFGAGLWIGRDVAPQAPSPVATRTPGPNPALALRTSLPADEPLPRIQPVSGPPVEARKIELGAQFRNAFLVAARSAFEMDLPDDGPLELHTGIGVIADDPLTVRGELRFQVVDRTPGHQATALYSRGVLATETARDGWFDCRISLGPPAPSITRVSFEVQSAARELPETEIARVRAAWEFPRVRRWSGAPRRANLVVVSLDTLRADHVGAYGYWRPTTPNLDRLARGGILFEQALAHASWTLPSHMSLFTSLLPETHGVTGPAPDDTPPSSLKVAVLSGDRPMLAEALKRVGYATAAFTGGAALDASLGFARGFDLYDSRLGPLTGYGAARVADWLDDRGRQPFFLFLHSYQIHAPYSGVYFAPAPPAGAREVNIAAYDGAIRQADRYLGMLLRRLRELGLYDDTLIVVLGDHGEEFGDHNPAYINDAHGHSLYDELLRVPLVIAHGRNPRFVTGRRIPDQVGLIDVMPTVLELLDVPAPDGLQGQSLVPLIRGGPGFARRAVIGACTLEDSQKWSLRKPEAKYILTTRRVPQDGDLAQAVEAPLQEELYELARDPGEKRNLCPAQPGRCAGLRRELVAVLSAARQARSSVSTSAGVRLDVEEQLRSLGYVK